jgi:hypothetical protein
MAYRIAADSVLMVHFLFAAFAVFGGILVAFSVNWAWLHIPVVLWSALVNLMGWTCPLTPLEKRLRVLSGRGSQATTEGSSSTMSDAPSIPAECPAQWN